jgi:putative FmdB family regulatory protein
MSPPIYSYKCPACEQEEDMLVSISEADTKQTCRICFAGMERTLTSPAGYSINGDNSSSVPSKASLTNVRVKT